MKVIGLEAKESLNLNLRDEVDPLDIAPDADRFLLMDRLDIRYDYKITAKSQMPLDQKI